MPHQVEKVNRVSSVYSESLITYGSYIPVKFTLYEFLVTYTWNTICLLGQVTNWGLFSTFDNFGSLE